MNLIGVDVDSVNLVCLRRCNGKTYPIKSFSNNATGHRKFIHWATQRGLTARVCMEATGVYSIPFALALHSADRIEVSVVNPKAIKKFADASLQRGKTDALDAACIADYLERMPFKPWQPPAEEILELQHISRRIIQLNTELTRERNRHKAALRMGSIGRVVAHDTLVNIRHLQRRIAAMEAEVLNLIASIPELQDDMDLLISVNGIAQKTASKLIAELHTLPQDMSASQWVAYAGLDPRPYESGTSTHKPRRITKAGNRYLREALYFPALVASRCDKNVAAYYQKLITNGKKPLQAIVAIMRKLLLAIWGMLHHRTKWDGQKFYRVTEN